jgi:probable phosphoglycerate mutase
VPCRMPARLALEDRHRHLALVTLLAAIIFTVAPATASGVYTATQEPLLVFLVRHAEKIDQSKDPELSAAGLARANALANTLRSAEIQHVHSSDYIRTRRTASPTAAAFDLEVQLYNPWKMAELAAKLRRTGGRHLVVGHSDTTPEMVELLTGESPPAIDEAAEYDRLYIVTISGDEAASSVLMRYGAPYRN